MNIVERALANNELVQLLEGKGNYKLENDSWASINAPIDWTKVVPMIYREYEKERDELIVNSYSEAIEKMLLGEANEVYCGVAVLYFQILREESNRSPFSINREHLLKIAKRSIVKKTEDLRNLKLFAEASDEDSLLKEVNRFRRLFMEKYGIEI